MDNKDSISTQNPSAGPAIGNNFPCAKRSSLELDGDSMEWVDVILNENKTTLPAVVLAFKQTLDGIQQSFTRKSYPLAFDPMLKSVSNHINTLTDLANSLFRGQDGAVLKKPVPKDAAPGNFDQFNALFDDVEDHANGLSFLIGTIATMLYDAARFCGKSTEFTLFRGIYESQRIKEQLQATMHRCVADMRDELLTEYASKPIEPKQPVVTESDPANPTEPDASKSDEQMTDPVSISE
jgi:hypothetical protein